MAPSAMLVMLASAVEVEQTGEWLRQYLPDRDAPQFTCPVLIHMEAIVRLPTDCCID
jgi:hypothetical protein